VNFVTTELNIILLAMTILQIPIISKKIASKVKQNKGKEYFETGKKKKRMKTMMYSLIL